MQPQTLLVFDIGTVPDKHHHEGDGFPILPFHQIVAIAFLEADINRTGAGKEYTLRDLRCGGEAAQATSRYSPCVLVTTTRPLPLVTT